MIYEELIKIFKKMIAEFRYDNTIAKINQAYEDNGLSAYEIREQDYDRTARDKNGICFNFALFLSILLPGQIAIDI